LEEEEAEEEKEVEEEETPDYCVFCFSLFLK